MLILSRGTAFLLFCFLLFFPSSSLGSSDVIINEIAWMGTKNSGNDEWIELYNSGDAPVALENWTLKSISGSLKINLKGIIPAKGFYLLERSDDDTVPSLKADFVYTGALKNAGEIIELTSNLVNPINVVDCSGGWTAGNNETKQTMERIGENEWHDSKEPGGTPKQANGTSIKTREKTVEEYFSGIFINELLPSPEGPDSENEWIEIFNQNDFEIDLSGWKISDLVGAVKTYVFPENTKIIGKGLLALYRPETGITLNNEGDGLKLFNPGGTLADSVTYEKAIDQQSFARSGTSWSWSSSPTPGKENKIVLKYAGAVSKKENKKPGSASIEGERMVAEIARPIEKRGSEKQGELLPVYAFALTISLFSGIVILMLKKKIQQLN